MSGSTRTKARRGQGEDSIYQDGETLAWGCLAGVRS